uniref:Uncharacterized protein n=1 Tax=Fomitiporia mediterranea TaxID=208960 RepID=A0A5B9RK99_9AGAM|nr:hypothetical protein Fomme_000087 [Fomitiporia mediterranea]QEG57097.1 hypothetical protein Fomme_000087 [Fomitiporia mediterranea]
MNIKDFLRKYLLPDALACKSTDLWVRARFGQKDPSALQQDLVKVQAENESVRASTLQELSEATTDLDTTHIPEIIFNARTISLDKSNQRVKFLKEAVESLSNKLEDSSLSEVERLKFQSYYNCKVSELISAFNKNTAEIREFTAKVKGDVVDHLAASSSSNNVGDVSSTKNLESSSVLDNKDVKNSSFSDYLIELKDLVSKELDKLSPEQLYCFTIFMGFILIFVGLLFITTIFLGQSLIDYFNLEHRSPKLAKFLKLRQTIDKYYLYLFIIILNKFYLNLFIIIFYLIVIYYSA